MEKNLTLSNKLNAKKMAVIGMLSSISIVLGITGLGFIPIPPVKATIMHIPVIIGAILEGPLAGCLIGLIFGSFSIIQLVMTGSPLVAIFINPLISVLPRVLIGFTSYYAYRYLKTKKLSLKIGIGAAVGSLTNTFGVLGSIYMIYIDKYSSIFKISTSAAKKTLLTVGLINGIPEAILSVVISVPVILAIKKIHKNK